MFEVHTVIWLGGIFQASILRMACETSHACIAGSGTCYNLDIEWKAAELLRSIPNTLVHFWGKFSYSNFINGLMLFYIEGLKFLLKRVLH